MDKQQNTQITERLREHWASIEPRIVSQYSGVSSADLTGFTDANDLVTRIATKAQQPVVDVENQVREFASSASGGTDSR